MKYKSTMVDLLGKDCKKYEPYYQVGRQFWYFNENKWKLITITYKRSGIIFYTADGIEGENWMPINCIDSMHLVPQTIYLSELPYEVPSFVEFDDYDGLIKINIIQLKYLDISKKMCIFVSRKLTILNIKVMWNSSIFNTPMEVEEFLNENRKHITNVNITYNSKVEYYIVFYFDTDLVEEDQL